jgi:hypothetical protein
MAKIFKIEMYVVDYGDSGVTLDEIQESIDSHYDVISLIANVKEKEFEWDDDLKINSMYSVKEDFEEYFNNI